MLTEPIDILKHFPVRKSKKQKESFRSAVQSYIENLGYTCRFEKGSMGAQNVIIGDPDSAKFLVTAHYDTPAGLPFPNLITPCNAVAFIAYQLLVTIFMLTPSFVIAAIAELLLHEPLLTRAVYILSLYASIFLMLLGPANRNNANDNTSGVVTVLEMARTMPENLRERVCFVLFDLEEAGLIGSASYRKTHKKESENQIVLNLDCVGDGNEIVLFPNKKLKKDPEKMALLSAACGESGTKSISVRKKGFSYYPSDQKNFPYGVGIAAFRRNKLAGLYCSRIHTKKDTVLEQSNVNILRAALTTLIGTAVN